MYWRILLKRILKEQSGEIVKLINLVQDRYKRQSILNMVMHFQVA
jgi:hypothetical protein